jgi:hypothetical protein
VVSEVLVTPNNNLSVVACDSGSDKCIDFMGIAKSMHEVKDIILQVWDRVVFHRENKIGKQLDNLTKALPILEKLNAMEKEGALGPEKAELLRRKLSEGVLGFVEAGAIITEINTRATLEPRKIMAPERKLLVGPDLSSQMEKEKVDRDRHIEDEVAPKPKASTKKKQSIPEPIGEVVENEDIEALLDDPGVKKLFALMKNKSQKFEKQ